MTLQEINRVDGLLKDATRPPGASRCRREGSSR